MSERTALQVAETWLHVHLDLFTTPITFRDAVAMAQRAEPSLSSTALRRGLWNLISCNELEFTPDRLVMRKV